MHQQPDTLADYS